MIGLVKNHNDDPKKIAEIINFVKQKGGLEYAETQMKKYQETAFAILDTFPRVMPAPGWSNWYALLPSGINSGE
jgi:geranylgeranyl pyrophosphate synthase